MYNYLQSLNIQQTTIATEVGSATKHLFYSRRQKKNYSLNGFIAAQQ